VSERYFAPCPRGLEAALASEIGALGARSIAPTDGGVAFSGPTELAYHANLESRLASRILWQVAQGRYRNEDELYRLANGVDWKRHFAVDRTLRVDVAATRAPLASIEFATLRMRAAITGSPAATDSRSSTVAVSSLSRRSFIAAEGRTGRVAGSRHCKSFQRNSLRRAN